MNILLVNHYAGSPLHGMEYRAYYLSRDWVRAGHKVRIIAAAYSHIRSIQPTVDNSVITRRTTEFIDKIEYIWYPAPPYHGNGIGRVLNIWAFLRQVWADYRRLVVEFHPDAVIASSTYPLDIWVAKRLARLAKAKLVFEVHDLWPLSPIELGGMSPRHPFIKLCQWSENAAYRNADIVVSMLSKAHEHMAAHGLDLNKLHIVPNGIALDDWQGEGQPISGELLEYVKTAQDQGKMILGYAGAHGLPNALDTLLDAASLIKDKPICFLLVGDGLEKARLQQRVLFEGLSNVRMFAPIPKGQIPALLRNFDLAYIGWQRKPIYRFGVSPNKLIDYMMSAKPIIHSIEAGNDMVAENGCGISIPPQSPEAVVRAIQQMMIKSLAERAEMGQRGKAYVMANHDYRVLSKRFLDCLQ